MDHTSTFIGFAIRRNDRSIVNRCAHTYSTYRVERLRYAPLVPSLRQTMYRLLTRSAELLLRNTDLHVTYPY